MIKTIRGFTLSGTMVLTVSLMLPAIQSHAADTAKGSNIEQGKELAFSRKKGNCLACHMIKDGVSPGNIAPPLVMMKSRFPDKKVLRAQIWNASKRNPETSMPLFGKYEVLTESELDKVVDFIYSL